MCIRDSNGYNLLRELNLSISDREVQLSQKVISVIADRHFGVGFDQLAVISKGDFDAHLSFYNSDGSESFACGNATRCIARYLMDETSKKTLTLTTTHGQIPAVDLGNGETSVNMGQPALEWDKVPLAKNVPTLELPIEGCLLYTSPSPRDRTRSRMPSSA